MTFPANLKVFSVIGQSNASGKGNIADWPSDLPRHGSKIWSFNEDLQWVHPAIEPIQRTYVGPSLTFADQLLELNPGWPGVALVARGRPGSSIARWQSIGDGTSFFDQAKQDLELALSQSGGIHCGTLISQGEKDAQTKSDSLAWKKLAKRAINDWRHAFPPCPIVYVQLGEIPASQTSLFPYWEDVRAAQDDLASSDRRTVLVRTGDLALPDDDIHWSTANQIIIGKRAAHRMNELLQRIGGKYAA